MSIRHCSKPNERKDYMPTKKERDEYLRGLNPIDDLMFRKMAEHKEFCEEILRVILGDYELVVVHEKEHTDSIQTEKATESIKVWYFFSDYHYDDMIFLHAEQFMSDGLVQAI